MDLKALLVVILLTSLIAGCNNTINRGPGFSYQTAYIPSIEKDKTIMVLPFNDYLPQIDAARKVEMVLVKNGFNVKSYQRNSKEVEIRSGAGIEGLDERTTSNNKNIIGAKQNEITIEKYIAHEKVDADIYCEVLFNQKMNDVTVKVVESGNKKILGIASFSIFSSDYQLKKFLIDTNLLVIDPSSIQQNP